MRIQADIRKLAAYGLNIDDLRTTLGNANVNTPKGNFDGAMRAYTINANDQIRNASDYKSLIVAYKNGSPVRLSDVGDVVDGAQNDKLGAWMNETPAIILNIQRQPGANVISVVEGIKSLLPQLQATLPAAIDLNVLTDRTVTIRASVQDVEFELALAVILVVLVIFVFLRNARATLIPSLSVPLSLVGTLGAMYLFGFSLNNLSLMALDHRHRLRGRRRDRRDREHLTLHRGGRAAAAGRPSRLRADRLHHHLADGVADRGADPAAVHGRRGRTAVPRIRHHAVGHDPDLRGGVADVGADGLRQAAQARSGDARERLPALQPRRLRPDHRGLWPAR